MLGRRGLSPVTPVRPSAGQRAGAVSRFAFERPPQQGATPLPRPLTWQPPKTPLSPRIAAGTRTHGADRERRYGLEPRGPPQPGHRPAPARAGRSEPAAAAQQLLSERIPRGVARATRTLRPRRAGRDFRSAGHLAGSPPGRAWDVKRRESGAEKIFYFLNSDHTRVPFFSGPPKPKKRLDTEYRVVRFLAGADP